MNRTNTNNTQDLSKKEKQKAYNKEYYQKNKEKIKNQTHLYIEQNRERKAQADKLYREQHKEKKAQTDKAYQKQNREKIKQQQKDWYSANKHKVHAYQIKYRVERSQTDCLFKLKIALRMSLHKVFERIKQSKPADTLTLLGCTWEEAKAHFESLFQEGMSWENHGEWHIDHIRPVSSFGIDELHLINVISNLQPLWAKDNLIKSDRFI
jgi:hypothetical protein